ncbi:MAG: class I SAM-dependent methyltransferase [Chloroflexi bacterium]|nr:class I SAM-dependent methyltransferase [Chloroflexota bacterium]
MPCWKNRNATTAPALPNTTSGFTVTDATDHGETLNAEWAAEAAVVREALLSLPHVSSALELAPGTGIWTQELLRLADRVVAVDAAPEMLAINQAKLQSDRVTYHLADLYEWEPDEPFDMIFFGFWLSHVPPEMLDGFLKRVAGWLKPGGHVFMVDLRRTPSSTAPDNRLPEADEIIATRKLNDGQTYRVYKIFYEPADLVGHFARAGLDASAAVTDHYFVYASATRSTD